jgi:hypothetical protein
MAAIAIVKRRFIDDLAGCEAKDAIGALLRAEETRLLSRSLQVNVQNPRIYRPILDPMNQQSTTSLDIDTPGRALVEITRPVTEWVDAQRVQTGLLTLFIRQPPPAS